MPRLRMLPTGRESDFEGIPAVRVVLDCDQCQQPILDVLANVVYDSADGESHRFRVVHQACDTGAEPSSIELQRFIVETALRYLSPDDLIELAAHANTD